MNGIGLKKVIVFVTLIAVFGSVALAAEAGPGHRGRFGPGNDRALAQDPNQAVPDRPMRNRNNGFRIGRGPRAGRPDESATTDDANVPENRGPGYGRGFDRNQGQNWGRGRGQQAEPGQDADLGREQGYGRGRYFHREMNRESEQQAGPGPGARLGRGRAFRRYMDRDEEQQTCQGPGARLGRGQGFGRGEMQGRLNRNPGREDGRGQGVRLGRRHRFGRNRQELRGPNEEQRSYGHRGERGRGEAEVARPGQMRGRGGSTRWYSYEYWQQIPERFLGHQHGRRQNMAVPDESTQQERTTRPHRPMRDQGRFWEE